MNEKPQVSVVVPVYRNEEGLARLLDSLASQTYPSERLEVIVVDNGGNPGVVALCARRPGTTVIAEPVASSYAARNRGISGARGDVIGFVDFDCIADPDWILRAVRQLGARGHHEVVAGDVLTAPRRPGAPTVVELYDIHVHGIDQRRFVADNDFAATANLFAPRSLLEEVGGFDPRLTSSGDLEWGLRLARSGHRLHFAADAIVTHPARRNLRAVIRKQRRLTGGWAQVRRSARESRWVTVLNALRDGRRALSCWRRIPYPSASSRLLRSAPVLALVLGIEVIRLLERLRLSLGGQPVR